MVREFEAQTPVAVEMKTPGSLPGDFVTVYPQVESAVAKALLGKSLQVPQSEDSIYGVYRVQQGEKGKNLILMATTSTVTVIKKRGEGEERVIKVLREPSQNHKGHPDNGQYWNEILGHNLFAWSGPDDERHDLELGAKIQEDCLQGEQARGVFLSDGASPYLGLVGVFQRQDGIEVVPAEQVSAADRVWPALLMQRADLNFGTAKIIQQWAAGLAKGGDATAKWPELNDRDIAYLAAQNALAFDRGRVEAPKGIKQRYGSLNFFFRCLTQETPFQASQMHINFPGNPEIVLAAGAAREVVKKTAEFIERYPYWIEMMGETVAIGHADSKPSNSALAAGSREEALAMIKGEIPFKFIILDAQSLALKPGMMQDAQNPKIPSAGTDYAHWCIVPRCQQIAYGLKMLLGMNLEGIHDQALEMVLGDMGESWTREQKALYYLNVAYKMGGVEPFVNAHNWASGERKDDPHLQTVMNCYPAAAIAAVRKAEQLMN